MSDTLTVEGHDVTVAQTGPEAWSARCDCGTHPAHPFPGFAEAEKWGAEHLFDAIGTDGGSRVIACAAITVGDRITEVDTPQGPFYPVVRETLKSFWIGTDAGEVRIGKSAHAAVRVAR